MNSLVYGPNVVAVKGNYDEVNRLCSEIADRNASWAFVNINVRAFYSEGSKTLAYEVAEQLGWRAPDHVVVPIASGSMLIKIHKGFNELKKLGLIDASTRVRISGAQAEGCNPVAHAFDSGTDFIKPVEPDTIAKSLAIGNPADGCYALDTIRKTGGAAAQVTDEEIVEGIKLLARNRRHFHRDRGRRDHRRLEETGGERRNQARRNNRCLYHRHRLKNAGSSCRHVGAPLLIEPNLKSFEEVVNGR